MFKSSRKFLTGLLIGTGLFIFGASVTLALEEPLELKVGDYVFTFDYDSPAEVLQNRLTRFLVTYTPTPKVPTPARVIIVKDDQPITSFVTQDNPIELGAKFEKVGRYQMVVELNDVQKTKAVFPFKVGDPDRVFRPWEEPGSFSALIAGLLGMLLGFLVARASRRPDSP